MICDKDGAHAGDADGVYNGRNSCTDCLMCNKNAVMRCYDYDKNNKSNNIVVVSVMVYGGEGGGSDGGEETMAGIRKSCVKDRTSLDKSKTNESEEY